MSRPLECVGSRRLHVVAIVVLCLWASTWLWPQSQIRIRLPTVNNLDGFLSFFVGHGYLDAELVYVPSTPRVTPHAGLLPGYVASTNHGYRVASLSEWVRSPNDDRNLLTLNASSGIRPEPRFELPWVSLRKRIRNTGFYRCKNGLVAAVEVPLSLVFWACLAPSIWRLGCRTRDV